METSLNVDTWCPLKQNFIKLSDMRKDMVNKYDEAKQYTRFTCGPPPLRHFQQKVIAKS